MKTITTIVFFASLAFGQEKLSEEARAQAWATVEAAAPPEKSGGNKSSTLTASSAPSIPQIKGAMLPREQQLNDIGERVWLTYSLPGTYLLQGVTCAGEPMRLGELSQGSIGQQIFIPTLVVNTATLMGALPFQSPLCFINVFRLSGGQVEQLRVELNEHPKPIAPRILGEGYNGTQYFLYISGDAPIDATMGVGRSAISVEKQRMSDGNIAVVFSQDSHLPGLGLATFTICRNGSCESQVFERRITLPVPKG